MAVTARSASPVEWTLELTSESSFVDDLGLFGEWVGPRTGPLKRTQGQKEAYVLRRLLVALRAVGGLSYPTLIRAVPTGEQGPSRLPDFVMKEGPGAAMGMEIVEAGEEDYQRWLTHDADNRTATLPDDLGASTRRTADEIFRALEKKVEKFDQGHYRGMTLVDLTIYDNSSWGSFLDKREVLDALGRPNALIGRFRRFHMVFSSTVVLDVFGERRFVDIASRYETDYTAWLADQIDRLRKADLGSLDLADIAEELSDLGKNQQHAVVSHLANLILHLLKWEFQPGKRSHGWEASIRASRRNLYRLLHANPSLRGHARKSAGDAYVDARDEAIKETGLPPTTFPVTCPYAYDQIVDSEFLPGPAA
jgi:hypothetical protein